MTHVVPLHGMQRWHGVHLTYVLASLADVTQPHTCILLPACLQPSFVTMYANILPPHDTWLLLQNVGKTLYVLLGAKVPYHIGIKCAADALHPPVLIA